MDLDIKKKAIKNLKNVKAEQNQNLQEEEDKINLKDHSKNQTMHQKLMSKTTTNSPHYDEDF